MSRRTPVKELIDKEGVPGSPRRKSTRIAAKQIEEKEVIAPVTRSAKAKSQKDDDEVSVGSNASSSSVRKVTRAASKSPTLKDGPARRTRRASSTSSLQEAVVSASPAPRRRSTRSVSTSPSSEIQESMQNIRKSRLLKTPPPTDGDTIYISARPRGRRLSINEKHELKESDEEIPQIDLTEENEDNLPIKKKRKTLNLQTIEEKSFVEDPEDKFDLTESVKAKVSLPRFSLSLLKGAEVKMQEERELVVLLEKSNVINEENTEVNKDEIPKEANEMLVVNISGDSDSVFNISGEARQLENIAININNTVATPEAHELSSTIKLDESSSKEPVPTADIVEKEKSSPVISNKATVNTSESKTSLPLIIAESPEDGNKSAELEVDTVQQEEELQNNTDAEFVKTGQTPSSPNATLLQTVENQIVSPKMDKSLVASEIQNNHSILKEGKSSDANVSVSSDSSDKENQKQLNVESHGEKLPSLTKEMSYCEPMEVEYASFVDKSIINGSEINNSPKPRSPLPLQAAVDNINNVINSSTPKNLDSEILKKRFSNNIESSPKTSLVTTKETNVIVVNSSSVDPHLKDPFNTPKQVDAKADKSLDNVVHETSMVEASELDPDEYEEGHSSIVHSSDEELTEIGKRALANTSSIFKTPDLAKHPLLSKETYKALNTTVNDSDDPDFDLNAKIDELVAKHDGNESSSEESITHFLDEFAEEGEEDTPSEGSNDISEKGESLGSNDSDIASDDDSYEGSFIDDAENRELLSGNESGFDDDVPKQTKKRRRIIIEDDDDDEVVMNGDVQDDDLEKMSTRPYCGLSPPSVISMRESPTLEECLSTTIINKQDNLQSLEEIKQVSPAKKLPEPVAQLIDTSTPNNSLAENTSVNSRKRLSSIKIVDNITAEDIEGGGIGERISKVIDAFYSGVKETSLNTSGSFALNISLDFKELSDKDNEQSLGTKEYQSSNEHNVLSTQIDKNIKVNSLSGEQKIPVSKACKKKKQKDNKEAPAETSKIPIRHKEETEKDIPKIETTELKVHKIKTNKKLKSSKVDEIATVELSVKNTVSLDDNKEKSRKKKKLKIVSEPLIEPTTSKFSVDLKKKLKHKKDALDNKERKLHKLSRKHDDILPEQSPPKKVKLSKKSTLDKQKSKNTILNVQDSEWLTEEINVSYFPSSLLNVVTETDKKSKVRPRKPLPGTSHEDRMLWGFTSCKQVFPSTSNVESSTDYAKTLPTKDFKNKMLFDPTRVTRENMKSYLKKKEKTTK